MNPRIGGRFGRALDGTILVLVLVVGGTISIVGGIIEEIRWTVRAWRQGR